MKRSFLLVVLVFSGTLSNVATASDRDDGIWRRLTHTTSTYSSSIYDPVRDRFIVLDEQNGLGPVGVVWSLDPSRNFAWAKRTPAGAPADLHPSIAAIYDPVGDRVVVISALRGSAALDQVWVLPLSGESVWSRLDILGSPPAQRSGFTAIYDPTRHRVVLFGGIGVLGFTSDVWELSLAGVPEWKQLLPAGPAAPDVRAFHTAVYDPVGARMVVFGGYRSGSHSSPSSDVVPQSPRSPQSTISPQSPPQPVYFGDTWALSLSDVPSWTRIETPGVSPGARYLHSTIYDPTRKAMLIFGSDGQKKIWALSLNGSPQWSRLEPMGDPPTPTGFDATVYDPVRNQMLVWGGRGNRLWTLSLGLFPEWVARTPQGRAYHTAILDSRNDRMLIFGGGETAPTNELWAFSLGAEPGWTRLHPYGTPPPPRWGHSAIHDPIRNRMIIFGGNAVACCDRQGELDDVWILTLGDSPSWWELSPSGAKPFPRFWHSAAYDSKRDRMIVFGGDGFAPFLNEVWALSLTEGGWSKLSVAGEPPSPRVNHAAIYDAENDRIVVYGGWDGTNSRRDIWALSLGDNPTWNELSPTGYIVLDRSSHDAVYDPDRGRMLVFGGLYDNHVLLNDMMELTLGESPIWAELLVRLAIPQSPPAPRQAHTILYDRERDRVLVYGGKKLAQFVGVDMLNDVWALELGTPARQVTIDIRPGSPQDRINLRSKGLLRVAILSEEDFDARRIDPTTVSLSGAAARQNQNRVSMPAFPDVNRDGREDLILHFEMAEIELPDGSSVLRLTGETMDGLRIRSLGSIQVISSDIRRAGSGGRSVTKPNASHSGTRLQLKLQTFPVGFGETGLGLHFTLAGPEIAILEVFNIRGRRIARQEVGSLGAGDHDFRVATGSRLAPGIYFVRLTQANKTVYAKAVVLQ